MHIYIHINIRTFTLKNTYSQLPEQEPRGGGSWALAFSSFFSLDFFFLDEGLRPAGPWHRAAPLLSSRGRAEAPPGDTPQDPGPRKAADPSSGPWEPA